jgi:hypothetical protein
MAVWTAHASSTLHLPCMSSVTTIARIYAALMSFNRSKFSAASLKTGWPEPAPFKGGYGDVRPWLSRLALMSALTLLTNSPIFPSSAGLDQGWLCSAQIYGALQLVDHYHGFPGRLKRDDVGTLPKSVATSSAEGLWYFLRVSGLGAARKNGFEEQQGSHSEVLQRCR